jgi:signal recognition particle receptor subunit beta
MPHISVESREIYFKIVYFGPGCSGKTTNLLQIYSRMGSDHRGGMITLNTEGERTLFFDFFPLELGKVEGYSVRFHLYTIPGQVHYEASRRLILEGADGVVFVADSQPAKMDENLESFSSMQKNLREMLPRFEGFPLVIQYNKRDLSPSIELGSIEKALSLGGIPRTLAIAVQGKGVMETLRMISREVVQSFQI